MVTLVAMAAMILAVLLVVANVTTGRIDASLKDRIAATEAAATRGGDGRLKVTNLGADDVIDSVWVFDAQRTQVSGPRAGRRIRAVVTSLSGVPTLTRIDRGDRVYIARPIRLSGERDAAGVAVAGESTKPYEDSRNILIGGLAVLGVLVTAVTAAITAWTVRRTLGPVQRMTVLAAEWNDRDLESRFHLGAGTDEFSQLGNTLDALLDRVANALRNEQQLTAELAHELRTPLTTIRAEAELGTLSDVDRATHDRLRRVMAEVDRLDGTITTLLALARHQHGSVRTADLATVLGGLVELQEAREAGVPISVSFVPDDQGVDGPASSDPRRLGVSSADIQILGSADLVERVIAPVLDNAVRYAATSVEIKVERTGDDVVVQVHDDGPGIVSEYEDDVFLAGVGDPDSEGAGLGLPLSRRVAAGLGGSVHVRCYRQPTIIEIRLPAG
jgi:two-component system OmpR family sensor kinase